MLPVTIPPLLPLIDTWTIVDTGSTDGTEEVAQSLLNGIPGVLHHREWRDYGANRTELLELAKGSADWLLTVDADMKAEVHHGLKDWLAGDPSPPTDAWQVEIRDGWTWRLPWLIRGGLEWEYVGACHEYLAPIRSQRPLLGLTLTHLRPGGSSERFEEYIQLLAAGVEEGDPRAVFYTAESLRFLGRTEEAAAMYDRRAGMDAFEEEAWFAQYQAAKLRADVGELVKAHERRPWRHEPLSAAAAIVRNGGPQDDILFMEA